MTKARTGWIRPRLDLGLRALAPELRAIVSRQGMRADLSAGLGAGSLTLLLGLWVAADTGLSPIQIVVTSVIAGVVGTLLSGARIASDGPALAATVALSALATGHGPLAVGMACLVAGVLQLVAGALGLGRVALLAPVGVARGFVMGMGGYLMVHALPHVLGIEAPAHLTALEVLDHVGTHLSRASLPALAIGVICLGASLVGLRWAPRWPVVMAVVIAVALVGLAVDLGVPTLAEDAASLVPRVGLPALPRSEIAAVAGLSITVALVTSLETLLSAHATHELDTGHPPDPDQDLIGNGLSSLLAAFLGGMPASASIARAWPLRRAEPTGRRAGLVVAVVALLVGPLLVWLAPSVPLAALSAVALSLGLPLLDPRPLVRLFRQAPLEAGVATLTFAATVLVGLVEGITLGMGLSLVSAAVNVARARFSLFVGKDGRSHQVSLSGPLTFLSAAMLGDLLRRLDGLPAEGGLILDLRSVAYLDGTGALRLLEIIGRFRGRGGKVALLGVSPTCRAVLDRAAVGTGDADAATTLATSYAVGDKEIDTIIGRSGAFQAQAHVLAGLDRFREEMRAHYTPLFDQLADGQSPHTLLITCVDSRINPELLTGAHPGELFIVRCLGALVAPLGQDNLPNEAAAVEYAVGVLGVRNVVVCGHSKCGAIKAIKSGHAPTELEALNRWMGRVESASGDLSSHEDVDDAARAAIARQLDNLRTIPQVKAREASGELELRAWFYDVGKAEVFEWDPAARRYRIAGNNDRMSLRPGSMPPPSVP